MGFARCASETNTKRETASTFAISKSMTGFPRAERSPSGFVALEIALMGLGNSVCPKVEMCKCRKGELPSIKSLSGTLGPGHEQTRARSAETDEGIC